MSIIKNKSQDKQIESILEYFRDEKGRNAFYQFYKDLADMYEVISPDVFLRPYIDDYDTLTRMYRIIKEAYDPGLILDRELTRKTARLVQEHTKTDKIKSTLDIYEINENTLKKLEESSASDIERVFNLLKSIYKAVEKESANNPYLISIKERAELVSNLFRERQKTTEETLEELKKIVEEINNAKEERERKGLDGEAFSIYWILKNKEIPNPEDKAKEMETLLKYYPYWKISEEQEREVRMKTYRILQGLKNQTEIVDEIFRILRSVIK